MNTLSSHVLDTTSGKPAQKMQLLLTLPDGSTCSGETNSDGRFNQWNIDDFPAGEYCLRFFCKSYLLSKHGQSFYPFIDIHFEIEEQGGHYHIPLLISPHGYSSYRGS
ncbi:hydroxyisourate hydrolase [Glaciecola petra]|uniref:5-hydroxyisourate hydrolase n=1 Tax=Glaciecola petra TaxID=3075602 RepID=A0ABU2ZUY2_9ALTE|nr:hydroxyisourate hydrolase [Aestuariibacter sp. P117]MDT0596181.1 hydroxyisourate hydrolase [Aestuariibacter sp. P117]